MASPLSRDKEVEAHLPEAQAMVLMRRAELGTAHILLEERAARQVADEIGLQFTGFIGILIAMARAGSLTPDEVRAALEECRQQGTFSDTGEKLPLFGCAHQRSRPKKYELMKVSVKRIEPHEPREELIGPEDVEHDLAVIEETWRRKRLENIARALAGDVKLGELVDWLVRTGVCKDEKEVIMRALETFFVAVAPAAEHKRLLSQ